MKKYTFILFIAGFLLTSFTLLQSTPSENGKEGEPAGINFQSISFQEALNKAKRENKLIFLDAYTDWCGPCKMMARTTFKDKEVGEYFNKNFINMKVEMEKDSDGAEIFKRYSVRAYPTLLFIDGNGKLVNRLLGFREAKEFLPAVKNALNGK